MADEIFRPTRNATVTVGTTSTVIGEPNTDQNPKSTRVFRNTSDADTKIITIHMGEGAAVANEGIVLRRNESFADTSETGYKCWQGRISAICAVAGGQLSVFER